MAREFVMLAKRFDPRRHQIGGWFASTKYDGMRVFWDGGITRGIPKTDVPWANNDKDGRYVTPPVATGLWSRYGNVIHAPDYFIDQLPTNLFLDGELWSGRGQFQETRKIVSTLIPGPKWVNVKFLAFETPPPDSIFQSGKINNINFKLQVDEGTCKNFLNGRIENRFRQFKDVPDYLKDVSSEILEPVEQVQLPWNEKEARAMLMDLLEIETVQGGEGLIIRCPNSYWGPKRMSQLLKVKKLDRDSGTVVGYKWGERGVEDKLFGLMGAVTVKCDNGIFDLSGFTHVPDGGERVMHVGEERADYLGRANPGGIVEDCVESKLFPRGSQIDFWHSGMTDKGLPREARYCRAS